LVSSLPDFTDEGLLPPGEYDVTFEELRTSVLVEGPAPDSVWRENWDAEWRTKTTRNREPSLRSEGKYGLAKRLGGSQKRNAGRPLLICIDPGNDPLGDG